VPCGTEKENKGRGKDEQEGGREGGQEGRLTVSPSPMTATRLPGVGVSSFMVVKVDGWWKGLVLGDSD